MKFKELVEDILIESTREYTPMNIISLINTIKECKDIKKVCIDPNYYDSTYNNYAIDIKLIKGNKYYQDYIIWYRYIDKNTTILITGIRDRHYYYCVEVSKDVPKGYRHKFTENEKRYINTKD